MGYIYRTTSIRTYCGYRTWQLTLTVLVQVLVIMYSKQLSRQCCVCTAMYVLYYTSVLCRTVQQPSFTSCVRPYWRIRWCTHHCRYISTSIKRMNWEVWPTCHLKDIGSGKFSGIVLIPYLFGCIMYEYEWIYSRMCIRCVYLCTNGCTYYIYVEIIFPCYWWNKIQTLCSILKPLICLGTYILSYCGSVLLLYTHYVVLAMYDVLYICLHYITNLWLYYYAY